MTAKKKHEFPKVAIVLWKDAMGYEARSVGLDVLKDNKARSMMVISTGIVIHDDDEGIAMTQSMDIIDDKKNCGDYPLCIPKEYIKKKKYLK